MDIGMLKSSSAMAGEEQPTCLGNGASGAGSAVVGTEVPCNRVSTDLMYNSAGDGQTAELTPTSNDEAGSAKVELAAAKNLSATMCWAAAAGPLELEALDLVSRAMRSFLACFATSFFSEVFNNAHSDDGMASGLSVPRSGVL